MRTRAELTLATLESARQTLTGNLAGVTLEEALYAAGGYRSVLGIVKHTAAWSHGYHSFAFDPAPRHWRAIDWPRGLRDTIEPKQDYVDEILAWFGLAAENWAESLRGLLDGGFDEPRPCHWGASAPLFDIVLMVANHWCYHAGEINAILSVVRRAAWEYTEEVEENHISTAGHRVRPGWMNDAQASAYDAYRIRRDEQIRDGT
jgi:Protein of unknown function (DUF664)